MKTLVVDAYDSFVHIIDQYLRALAAGPLVLRSHEATADRIRAEQPDVLLLGPGPGHPDQSSHVELVHEFAGRLPILGVCLGLQAIGVAYGGLVRPAEHLMHGKTSLIAHDGRGCFSRCAPNVTATRYHSLILDDDAVPDELEVSARSCDDGYVMAVRHRTLAVEAVQFHPESVTTLGGLDVFAGFLGTYVEAWDDPGAAVR